MDQFLSSISRRREGVRRRLSSYDRTGGNRDYLVLQPGENRRFAEIHGAGRITHIWITAAPNRIEDGEYLMRKLVLRTWTCPPALPRKRRRRSGIGRTRRAALSATGPMRTTPGTWISRMSRPNDPADIPHNWIAAWGLFPNRICLRQPPVLFYRQSEGCRCETGTYAAGACSADRNGPYL